MNKKHEFTLENIKKSPKVGERRFRASDFLTESQMEELHRVNERGRKIVRPYDDVDAFSAEVLARFGWLTYQAWKNGEISTDKIMRFIAAERARTTAEGLPSQITLVSAIAGANHPTKHKSAPQSLKNAIKMIKEQQKQAKGIQ